MNWTIEQKNAIDKENSNIIVSAGAGSGKTAVLTERVIRKLKNGVNISNLLVLTFTEAAASEMKERIRKAIKNSKDIKSQLDYIDSAYITTFDSYALSIVKKYHYLLNISPHVSIIDSSIINIVKKENLDQIFEELYEKNDQNFLQLINDFCDKDDENIKKIILKINNSLDMYIDKNDYLKNYIENYYNQKNLDKIYQDYEKLIIDKINTIKNIVNEISIYDNDYYHKLSDDISPLLQADNYEAIQKSIVNKLPILRNADEITKYFKEDLNTKLKELNTLVVLSKEDIIKSLLSTKSYALAIIKIINKLDDKITKYKQENDSYEFIDVFKMAIKIISEHEEVRKYLKSYYNEIMIDEYQDTNDLQEMFISLLDNNNIYMVGDVKQSIYRFRNANPNIFKDKYDKYSTNEKGYKIDLVKNFRSRSEVLNGINEIFNLLMDNQLGGADYKKSHQMIYGNLSYNNEGKTIQNNNIELLNYAFENKKYTKEEIEIFTVAHDIKEKINNKYQVYEFGKAKTRDATYSDFCIIMDRNTAFDKYKKIFEYLNIPSSLYKDEVLTNKDDIFIIKNLLNLIIKINKKEYDQEFRYYFTSVARSFLFEYDDNTIFEIFKNKQFKKDKIYIISEIISEKLESLSNLEFLNQVIKDFDFYNLSIKIGNVNEFMVRIEYLQNQALILEKLGYTPYIFANYMKEMVDSEDEIKYSLNPSTSNSVKIMNIHKSKGLEFSVCYFTGLYKNFNIDDIKSQFILDKKYGIITPYYNQTIRDTITKILYKESYLKEEVSEKIRLFYVALTRCKEKAILVGDFNKEEMPLNKNIKLKYRSFQDMIISIKSNLLEHIKDIDMNSIKITKEYNLIKKINYENKINKTEDKIQTKKVRLDNSTIHESRFSKISNKLVTKEEQENIEYGTKVHYMFEQENLKNTDNKIVKKFLSHEEIGDIKNSKIYKEYEFIYKDEENLYRGVIDLMIEYEDEIKIIDYKLKDIKDEHYKKQLDGYKEYIKKKTTKTVTTYLYSITNDILKKID